MIEFKVDQMFKMPTGEVLKIKKLGKKSFSCRLFGLKGAWTEFYIEGSSDKLHMFFNHGATFVKPDDYPNEDSNG